MLEAGRGGDLGLQLSARDDDAVGGEPLGVGPALLRADREQSLDADGAAFLDGEFEDAKLAARPFAATSGRADPAMAALFCGSMHLLAARIAVGTTVRKPSVSRHHGPAVRAPAALREADHSPLGGVPAIRGCFSRFHGTVQQGPVQRQETQIVQSCKTLGDSLPGFRPQAIRPRGGSVPSGAAGPIWGEAPPRPPVAARCS